MTTTHAPEILRGIASPIDYLFTPYIHTANYQNTKLTYYNAGLPGYESSFPRDNAVAALLSGDLHLLLTHLATCVRFQATEINPKNGAYPGKIHHEIHIENERIVPISLQGSTGEYTTEYNSCDSTALFLISVEQLSHIDAAAYEQFVAANRAHIVAAAKHITHMLNQDNLFTDTPPTASPHDPGNYELRVTYWKDSILPHTDGKQRPEYPVSFALAHFMAARALVSAATVLKSHEYAALADTMFTHGIATFVQASGFTVYKDVSETYVQHSSDELHSLAYIPSRYAHLLPLSAIAERAKSLETPFGYVCTPKSIGEKLVDTYHGYKVWVFEQALIHYGANKFGLTHEAQVAARVAPYIGEGQELLGLQTNTDGSQKAFPQGNARQLWSVAAGVYFNHTPSDVGWL